MTSPIDSSPQAPVIVPIPETSGTGISTPVKSVAKQVALPPLEVSIWQKIMHILKIASALALLVVGTAAVLCLICGAPVPISGAVVMLIILLIAFVIVLLAIQDSTPSRIAKHMQQQINRFEEENTRLHDEVSNLQIVNGDLKARLSQLEELQSKLNDFGNKMEAHTGDLQSLVSEFREGLTEFKDVGSKVRDLVDPFEKLAEALRVTLSQEGIQELANTITALRQESNELKKVVADARFVLADIKREIASKEECIQLLENQKVALEEACAKLKTSIGSLQITTANLVAAEQRLTQSVSGSSESASVVESEDQDETATRSGGDGQ
ncbi:hypothetical protein [Chlamydia vaughanii]|uniref:hypothetical protein n=1 Tax=Chlamydia vaughanii TaxID=3112552 RepID=UPI0032B29B7E